jgi:hypothetical protein
MGFLSPVFLAAGLVVAVPLILHLFHRHDARRMAFPALRYLLRTEKEHARNIRLRQLLLLLLRMAAILLLVAAGARPFLRGGGGVHDPTATVIILDNSLSSGLIRGSNRVLDVLKSLAVKSVDSASDEDRLWLIRAGQPWDVAVTGSRSDLRRAIRSTEVTDAAGDIHAALERAAVLVSSVDLPAREVHLISDMQASAFTGTGPYSVSNDVPIVAFNERAPIPPNTHLDSLLIGGGLPPLANQRTRLSVKVSGANEEDGVPLRLVVANRIRGAATARSGGSTILPLGPFSVGRVSGYVESDPDDLRGDDRRYFSFSVRPPPTVATTGASSFFLSEAFPVLTDAGRIELTPPRDAEVLVSVAGAAVTEATGARRATVILPPADVTLLPGLNRTLAAAGIPWRYDLTDGRGEAGLTQWEGPVDLSEVRIHSHYLLTANDAGMDAGVLARLSSGEPWLVEGTTPRGPYLLLASDLEPESTNLAVTAAMVPLLGWIVARWGNADAAARSLVAGGVIATPPAATAIRDPKGALHPVDAAQPFRVTPWTGLYEILQNDSILGLVAVNAPASESVLDPIESDELHALVPGTITEVADTARWARALFSTGQGPEVWRWLLVATVLVLLAESLVAASGPSSAGSVSPFSSRATQDPTPA